jgi:hypothetical protein
MTALKTMAALAAALVAGVAGMAVAQPAPAAGTPPSWDILTHCAAMADEDARLSCYDTAMRAAGYAPKPAEVSAEKRQRFGLSLPQISLLRHHAKQEGAQSAQAAAAKTSTAAPAAAAKVEDDPNRVTVQLDVVATIQPSRRLMLFTTDGAVWMQTDDELVAPFPKAGQTMTIRRNTFGGYFCDFDKRTAVRCERKR